MPITKVLIAHGSWLMEWERVVHQLPCSPSVLLHPLDLADHLIQVLRLNIHAMSWKSKLNLPKWHKNRPHNWDIKQGSRFDPSRLEIETFIGVYSIFIGTSYLLVCSVICSCCWRSSRSGGAESCFSVVLSPICLSTWKIQGNIKGLYSELTSNDFNVFERYPNL